ncbi:MAG: hypothetical protein A2017_12840 [Lentisphaerae bacterium GWF2_44_16]|nr:MAG: hypothetical protein A2017_12840 [Lentisphaerae bacterium GWF2_44_16]
MGTIKDLVDLTTQLANSVQDRKIAAELNAIQSLILKIQSEQATLHETNIELREERLAFKERIQELEAEIERLKAASSIGPSDVPACPNCSTASKPFYMRPVPKDFVSIMDATHECPKCKYNMKVKK